MPLSHRTQGSGLGERLRPQSPEEQGGARVIITATTVSQDNSLPAAARKRPRDNEQGTATVGGGTPRSAR
ncbi:hypothetical protein HPB52_013914 [Rhipicephalus sanguineus]|uniref:Uncharacterized protein n=1 Tax=Rhipicephalus sanguineus TaxID=34632 RepID=A0A9D4PW86_RHISA|nr:hypothetical protein HPB52_013914 [Rhipicephalus sanguineus]